ncbi:MAG: Crp/Fnr family transcriptional regulator [Candidatus Arcticimaribacter sp.]|nr:MAG: Crp/Fnr family transcriptional regulator [Candidatus Arcticimaribacter sp.]
MRFNKRDIVQRAGEKAMKSYIVKKGLLRSYTIDEKGKEHIFMFAPEGWIISDIESYANDAKAVLHIDALEDTEVIAFNKDSIDTSKLPVDAVLEEFFRLLKRVSVLQRRVIMLMSAPAKLRYEHFLETYPQITNRVPQRMIASYLGITPEALSKLRGEIARQK